MSDSHYAELNGTHNGYYAIENAGQLYWFAKSVDEGTIGEVKTKTNYTTYQYVIVNAVLTADITDNTNVLDENGNLKNGDLRTWNPIGGKLSASTPYTYLYFCGIFDGNNKTVSGLYHDGYATSSSNESSNVGLFGNVTRESGSYPMAAVKNVTVKDSYFAGYEYVGGIAGSFYGIMENCNSYATVKGHQNIGGVAGGISTKATVVENCFNYGLVMGSNKTGGFAGTITYSEGINKCGNYGEVRWISGSRGYMGGFVSSVGNNAVITNCFNAGSVIYDSNSAYNEEVGGFAATIGSGSKLTNCYSSGSVTTKYTGDNYIVGGFAGSSYATLTNIYYNSENVIKGEQTVTDAFGKGTSELPTALTTADFASGKACYLLNGSSTEDNVIWKQTLKSDETPKFDGAIVYYDEDGNKYYNEDEEPAVTSYEITKYNTLKVEFAFPQEGKDVVIVFADYKAWDDLRFENVKFVPVTTTKTQGENIMSVPVPNGTELFAGDKIMIWEDFTTLKPLCKAYRVTGSEVIQEDTNPGIDLPIDRN